MTDSIGLWCGLFIWIFKDFPGGLMCSNVENLCVREFSDSGSSQSRSHHATTRPVPLLLLHLAVVTAPEIMLEKGSLNKLEAAWVPSLDIGLKRESVQSPQIALGTATNGGRKKKKR